MHLRIYLVYFFITLLLQSCSQSIGANNSTKSDLHFNTEVQLLADQELQVNLCVKNNSNVAISGYDDFEGEMILSFENTPRAKTNIYHLPEIPANSKYCMLEWKGKVETGNYILTWGNSNTISTKQFLIDEGQIVFLNQD